MNPPRSIAGIVLFLAAFTTFGETKAPAPEGVFFGLGLGIGVQNFHNPAYTGFGTEPEFITYQSLSLHPEFGWGKWAVAFSFTLNYRFTGGAAGNEFEIRREDWVVGNLEEFLSTYLPKIQHIRYGARGEPLFIKMGTLEDATLGSGFILGNYSNALYLPETRIFGLSFDFDGSLIAFPYFGLETFVSNLAQFDLIAGRMYVRPWLGSTLPLLPDLQLGATLATDQNPGYFAAKDADFPRGLLPPKDASVLIYGIDFRLPLLQGDMFSLALFGDGVAQKEGWGAMLGTSGRVIQFLTYGAQLRFLGDQFIPTYFGTTYDLFRPIQYQIYDGIVTKKGSIGWFASLGFSVLQDRLSFTTNAEGPFTNVAYNPFIWRAILLVEEGVVPGFFFDVLYQKQNMDDWNDFQRWREDALIRARVNYRSGPAVISLTYTLRYDPSVPGNNKWIVTSGLSSTISLY